MAKENQMIEVAGKDVEAAIATGLARLGVQRDAVDVEILDEGRQGMFGLGARAARVRLTITSRPEPEPTTEPSEPPTPPSDEAVAAEPQPVIEAEEATEAEKIEVVQGVMEDLLAAMDMDKAQVEVHRAEPGPSDDKVPPLVVDVRGPGLDVLIGRDGETLNALQSITRLIVGRQMRGWVHVVVDVQGYKADRAQALRNLAHRMADQAADSDRTVILEPMPPHERRVVHVALYDDPRVTTESIYEGERRRVTISPKDE